MSFYRPPGNVMTDTELAAFYRRTLLDDVVPFWLRHGMDSAHGGVTTAPDRDGALLDTDKSVWFQGRAAWTFGTLHRTLEARPEWLEASRSCVEFVRRHGEGPGGKLYFTVTREGAPLRMRRYAYSESFAAIANAVLPANTGEGRVRQPPTSRSTACSPMEPSTAAGSPTYGPPADTAAINAPNVRAGRRLARRRPARVALRRHARPRHQFAQQPDDGIRETHAAIMDSACPRPTSNQMDT